MSALCTITVCVCVVGGCLGMHAWALQLAACAASCPFYRPAAHALPSIAPPSPPSLPILPPFPSSLPLLLPQHPALCTLLGIAMAGRFNNTKKFFPAGLVALSSLGLAAAFVGVGL